MMSDWQLTDLRERTVKGGDLDRVWQDRRILLAEVLQMRAQMVAVEALADGPDARILFTDLRAALASADNTSGWRDVVQS